MIVETLTAASVVAGLAAALASPRPRAGAALLGLAVVLALGAAAAADSWAVVAVVALAALAGAAAVTTPEPDPAGLPTLRLPPGGRGPAAVRDDDEGPPVCVGCGRRPCTCPRQGAGEELVDPLDRARRALNRA